MEHILENADLNNIQMSEYKMKAVNIHIVQICG